MAIDVRALLERNRAEMGGAAQAAPTPVYNPGQDAFNVRALIMKNAREMPTGIEQPSFGENFKENMTEFLTSTGSGIFSGAGMLGDQLAGAAGAVDTAFGGDGENAVTRFGNNLTDNADRIVKYADQDRQPDNALSAFGRGVGQIIPTTGAALAAGGVGALAGGAGAAAPVLSNIAKVPGLITAITGEGLGEAERSRREQIAAGQDKDIARYQGYMAGAANMAADAIAEPLTNPLFGSIPGMAGRAIAAGGSESLEELYQKWIQEAAVSQPGVRLSPLDFVKAIYNNAKGTTGQDVKDALQAFGPSAILGAVGGGGTQQRLAQAPAAPQMPTTPAPAPVEAGTNNDIQEAGNAPVAPAVDTRAVRQGARGLLDSIANSEGDTFDEEGMNTNAMTDEQARRYAAIQRALTNNDIAGLQALGVTPEEAVAELDMVLGEGSFMRPGTPQAIAKASAMQMRDAGAESEAIRAATGWGLDVDRKVEREVADLESQFNIPSLGIRPLGQVYTNQEVLDAYPGLDRFPFTMTDKQALRGADGEFTTRGISLARDSVPDKRRTAAHEIQHAIDYMEGKPRGGNPDMMIQLDPKQLDTEYIRQQNAVLDAPKSETTSMARVMARDNIKAAQEEFAALSPFDKYQALQGEDVARQTAARVGMTQEERDANPIQRNPNAPLLYRKSTGGQVQTQTVEGSDKGGFTLGDALGVIKPGPDPTAEYDMVVPKQTPRDRMSRLVEKPVEQWNTQDVNNFYQDYYNEGFRDNAKDKRLESIDLDDPKTWKGPEFGNLAAQARQAEATLSAYQDRDVVDPAIEERLMNRVDELRGQAEQVYNQIEDTPDALTQRLNAIAERVDSEGFQWGPGVDENQFDMATANVKEGEDTFILKPGATKGDYYRMLASEGVHEGADTRDIQVLERLADRVDAGGTDDYWAAAKEIAEENGEEPPTKPSGFRSEVAAGVKKLGISGTQAEIANTVIGNTVDSFAKMSGLSPEQIWKELGISSFTKEALVSVQEGQVAVGRYGARAWGHNGALKLNINVKHPAALTHEISHWLTDVTEMLARKFPNNAAIQKQFQAIKEYVGWVKAQDNPSSEYYGLVRGQHEKMADALLKYLEEGVSPNAELKSFFERAKAYMIDLWDALINMHKVELTPGIREFFDRLIAGDQGFDYNYGEANMSARAGNIAALTPEDLKVPAAAVEEARKGFTLTESTKGNVTTVTKRVDRSDTVGILGEALHSPNIIAKYFPKFAPVFELARAARRTQDKLRTQWNHSIDKAFGGVGLFGQRKGGYAATKEQREELNELLYLGDFYGKTFTAEELRAEGYSDGAIKGYQHIRNVDAGILRRVNEHRKSVGLEAIVGLEGHMMHVFHSFRVYDSNGVHIQSFQTMKEASAFADTLASDARHITIKPVINDFSGQAQKDAVTVGDNQYQIIMNKLADVFALSAEDAREFGKGVIKRANKARFYGPAQQRTGFSGWSSDMEYAIRHQANLSARYIAMDTLKRNGRKYFEKAFGKFGNEYKGIAKYTKDYLNDVLGVPSKWEDAQNKMLERFGPIVARLSDRYADRPAVALGNAVSGLTASMKLGFLNLGSAILNMSALNGVGAATSYAQAVQAGAEYLRPTLTTKKLYAALGIDSDITMESASTYSGAKMYKKALSGVSTGAFQFFDGAARKIAAIAGYRDGLAKGMNERQAIDHAREIVDKTNFNYGVEDSPNIFRRSGPLGNVMLQFKKYPIKIMELGVNHLEGAQKAKFWAGQLVMSGLFGLPFTAVLKAVIKALFDDEDIEAEVKNLVASLGLPEPVARTLNYGIAANIGIDLGQRVGMGDIVPTRAQDFVGPGVGTIVDIVKSTTDWAQGETALVDEIGKLIPGIGNPMKAVFGGAADSYNPERNRDTYRTTGERILQATGLRPIGTSVRRDAIMIQREQQRDEQHAKQVAIDRYMDDPSPENRAELRRLKVNPAQVVRRKKMQPGDDYDRALRGARKREDRDALTGYVGALGVDQ